MSSETKLKPGDRVKCIDNNTWENEITVGNIYVSLSDSDYFFSGEYVTVKNDNGYARSFYTRRFELVEADTPSPSTDAELLELLNKGIETRIELHKRHGMHLEVLGEGKWQPLVKMADAYRIKPKPKFEPMPVGPWKAFVAQGKLVIGCQEFDITDITIGLACMLNGDSKYNISDSQALLASRQGINYGLHQISWTDAEKLHTALKKALKE